MDESQNKHPVMSGFAPTGPNSNILKKVAAVMKGSSRLAKLGENMGQHYSYVTEAQIAAQFKELLEEHGIVFTFDVDVLSMEPTPTGKQLLTTVRVAYAFHDIESGEKVTGHCIGQGADPTDKGVYKAITGAVKYIFLKTFLIPTGDDPENDSKTKTTGRKPKYVGEGQGDPFDEED